MTSGDEITPIQTVTGHFLVGSRLGLIVRGGRGFGASIRRAAFHFLDFELDHYRSVGRVSLRLSVVRSRSRLFKFSQKAWSSPRSCSTAATSCPIKSWFRVMRVPSMAFATS